MLNKSYVEKVGKKFGEGIWKWLKENLPLLQSLKQPKQ